MKKRRFLAFASICFCSVTIADYAAAENSPSFTSINLTSESNMTQSTEGFDSSEVQSTEEFLPSEAQPNEGAPLKKGELVGIWNSTWDFEGSEITTELAFDYEGNYRRLVYKDGTLIKAYEGIYEIFPDASEVQINDPTTTYFNFVTGEENYSEWITLKYQDDTLIDNEHVYSRSSAQSSEPEKDIVLEDSFSMDSLVGEWTSEWTAGGALINNIVTFDSQGNFRDVTYRNYEENEVIEGPYEINQGESLVKTYDASTVYQSPSTGEDVYQKWFEYTWEDGVLINGDHKYHKEETFENESSSASEIVEETADAEAFPVSEKNIRFRNFEWKTLLDDIIAAEVTSDMNENEDYAILDDGTLVFLKQEIVGYPCFTYFQFNSANELVGGMYLLQEKHDNGQAYLDDYNALSSKLQYLYGEPFYKVDDWENEQSIQTFWQDADGNNIFLLINVNDPDSCSITLNYRSPDIAENPTSEDLSGL